MDRHARDRMLELVALDATDIVRLASFYAELTGWQSVRNLSIP